MRTYYRNETRKYAQIRNGVACLRSILRLVVLVEERNVILDYFFCIFMFAV